MVRGRVGIPRSSVVPPQSQAGISTIQGTASQTLTDAPVWHLAKSWHDADPTLKGNGVKIGVIDGGGNGMEDLRGTDLPANS